MKMRFSVFAAVLSCLAMLATVIALPVEDSKLKQNVATFIPLPPTTPSSELHNVTLSAMIDKTAYELATKNPPLFLSEYVFRDLFVNEFKFGKKGDVSPNMISQHIVETVIRKNKYNFKLAIHLNCVVTASALQNNVITLHVEKFHITARTVADQETVDHHGPSSIIAQRSIHMGVHSKEWRRPDELDALAKELGLPSGKKLNNWLQKWGYNKAYVESLVKDFRFKVTQRIHQVLGGNVSIKWQGDKSFPPPLENSLYGN